jgi:multicomponent Na+:H+ antiporter subunit D
VVYQAFFGKRPAADAHHAYREAHPAMLVPLTLTAVISVIIGVYPDFFMNFARVLSP